MMIQIQKTKWVLTGALVGTMLVALLLPAHAQSSLGIGTAEPSIGITGPFSGLLHWINVQQQAFYRALTGALKAMRDDGSKLWLLIGLSFAYGIFHAVAPATARQSFHPICWPMKLR